MQGLSEHEVLLVLVATAVILVAARAAGEAARRVNQPEVLGQLAAGFILGPSVLGSVFAPLYHAVFLEHEVSMVLSGFSWLGAILLLLVAGLEIDLTILRQEVKVGALAAAGAIIPSLAAGTALGWFVFGPGPAEAAFLGIVLSVTAVSVAASILMERETMRRGYAQTIIAAGIVSEVLVWLMISVVSALHGASPLLAGARAALFAALFFLVMMTAGRRATFWAMRRVRDATWIVNGQLSFVLVMTFVAAAVTQALGLHALLGAFVFGVLLSQAPRKNEELLQSLQSLTAGMFAPVFFVLAGMRVNILQLHTLSIVATVALLFVVATTVKVSFSTLGAKIGGLRSWEAALVGVGLNLKGGTDVVVAVLGTELGLLSVRAYSMYAVVAILTVMLSPGIIDRLERRAPPTETEDQRLQHEEAGRRAYVPRLERVLVPVDARLMPSLAADVVQHIAQSKHDQGQIFDISRLEVRGNGTRESAPTANEARERLDTVKGLKEVQVAERQVSDEEALDAILNVSGEYDLIAIGAHPPREEGLPSLGDLQEAIVHGARTDVLVAVDHRSELFSCGTLRRILVPLNGLEYSMAAADIAGALAATCGSSVTLFMVVHSDLDQQFWKERDTERLKENASGMINEVAFRLGRLGLAVDQRVVVGERSAEAVLEELSRESYDLVVFGAVDRGTEDRPYLGRTVRTVLTRAEIPSVLLISRAA